MKIIKPSRNPQHINKYVWYYEFPGRIDLFHEIRLLDNTHLRTDTIRIPWRKLEKSMKRCRKHKGSHE